MNGKDEYPFPLMLMFFFLVLLAILAAAWQSWSSYQNREYIYYRLTDRQIVTTHVIDEDGNKRTEHEYIVCGRNETHETENTCSQVNRKTYNILHQFGATYKLEATYHERRNTLSIYDILSFKSPQPP